MAQTTFHSLPSAFRSERPFHDVVKPQSSRRFNHTWWIMKTLAEWSACSHVLVSHLVPHSPSHVHHLGIKTNTIYFKLSFQSNYLNYLAPLPHPRIKPRPVKLCGIMYISFSRNCGIMRTLCVCATLFCEKFGRILEQNKTCTNWHFETTSFCPLQMSLNRRNQFV